MKINFHSHSHYSDGKKTVKELAKEINNAKIDYFALSDHDTPNGYHELKKLVKKTKLIPAIEITAKYDEDHFFHILGLNIDPIKMEKELMKYGEKYNVSFEKAFNRFTKQNKHLKLNLSDYKVRSK
jgi:predicted metal-dependent phosphoesterase TrpH